MLPSSGHKSISRINSEKNNTFGWYVRVVFRGEMHSKFFSDAKHGTPEKALAQAVRHRNRVEREMGKPRTNRSVVAPKPGAGTGIVGVQRITKGSHEAFQVTWSPEPNVVSRTSVSIAKYGEADAFRRACRIREKKERALYGKAVMPMTRRENEAEAPHSLIASQSNSTRTSSTRSLSASAPTSGAKPSKKPTRTK